MRTELRANVKAMMERGIIEQRRLVDEKPRCRRCDHYNETLRFDATGQIRSKGLSKDPR